MLKMCYNIYYKIKSSALIGTPVITVILGHPLLLRYPYKNIREKCQFLLEIYATILTRFFIAYLSLLLF